MKLSALSKDTLESASNRSWGDVGDKVAVVADAVRLELLAQRFTQRRLLLDRILQTLEPVVLVETETVTATIEEMARTGEITRAERGILAPGPLRAVQLGEGRYRLFGGGSTQQLLMALSVEISVTGSSREARLTTGSEDFAQRVASLGGLVLTRERWSGVDRVPAPGSEWLGQIDEELSYSTAQPASFTGADGEWRSYRPEPGFERQLERWRKAEANSIQRLWRKRNESGYWVYAWTAGGRPEESSVLRLSSDDALRTALALDRLAEAPLTVNYEHKEDHVEFAFDGMFPRAEYRFLVTVGERIALGGSPLYRVPSGRWDYTSAFLTERLGVRVVAGGGA